MMCTVMIDNSTPHDCNCKVYRWWCFRFLNLREHLRLDRGDEFFEVSVSTDVYACIAIESKIFTVSFSSIPSSISGLWVDLF